MSGQGYQGMYSQRLERLHQIRLKRTTCTSQFRWVVCTQRCVHPIGPQRSEDTVDPSDSDERKRRMSMVVLRTFPLSTPQTSVELNKWLEAKFLSHWKAINTSPRPSQAPVSRGRSGRRPGPRTSVRPSKPEKASILVWTSMIHKHRCQWPTGFRNCGQKALQCLWSS